MYSESYFSHNWLIKRLLNVAIGRTLDLLHGTVYDLGCGERPFESDILQRAERYIGVDWSNSPHKLKCDLLADLNLPLPLESSIADGVVAFEVLEHLCEPRVMLGEAFRILKPGGILILSTPFQWHIHEAPWDFARYTKYGLTYLLEKSGFELLHVIETSGFWETWTLKLTYQSLRLIRGPLILRKMIKAFLIPLWWVSQSTAEFCGLRDRHTAETAGYVVAARKPG